MAKLDLTIELDSSGAVRSVQTLDASLNKLDGTAKTHTSTQTDLWKQVAIGSGVMMGMNEVISKGIQFVKDSVKEYIHSEEVQTRLNSTLRMSGESVEVMSGLYDILAKRLQYLVGVDDEQVKSLITLAYQYGINNEYVESAVKGAIGLASAFGIDVQTALKGVANAYEGNFAQLARYIPELRSASTTAEKMAILQRKMAEGFQLAGDAMDSTSGKMKRWDNAWKDFMEGFGQSTVFILESLETGLKSLGRISGNYNDIIGKMAVQNGQAKEQFKTKTVYHDLVLKEKTATESNEKTNKKIVEHLEGQKKAVEKILMAELDILPTTGKRYELTKKIFDLNSEIEKGVKSSADAFAKEAQAAFGVATASDKTKESITESASRLEIIKSVTMGVLDIFKQLGVESDFLSGIGDVAGGLFGALKKGASVEAIIAGVTTALGGLLKAIKSAFGGDGVGEAIERENAWMNLTKDQDKALRDLIKTVGDTHKATSMMLGDIIGSADINTGNFDKWVGRVHDILSDLDRGALTGQKFKDSMGSAFTAIIKAAQELGTEGGKGLTSLFESLAGRGQNIAEIQKYMAEQIKMGLEGYKDYLTGGFSSATIDVFEKILAYQKKVEANQPLINGIKGITDALNGLSNVQKLTEEEFDNFEQAGRDAFESLTRQGFTTKEALNTLAPYLSRLVFLNKEYGLTIDESTQALIDRARQEGINIDNMRSQDEIWGSICDNIGLLVDLFKNAFPDAVERGLARSMDAIDGFAHSLDDLPARGMAAATGVVQNIRMDFQGVSGTDAEVIAEKVKTAIADNIRGLRDTVAGVA